MRIAVLMCIAACCLSRTAITRESTSGALRDAQTLASEAPRADINPKNAAAQAYRRPLLAACERGKAVTRCAKRHRRPARTRRRASALKRPAASPRPVLPGEVRGGARAAFSNQAQATRSN